MIQVMIKSRVTGALIRMSRKKKANTDLYNQKNSDVSKRQNHKKETKKLGHTGHKGKDKKKGHTGYY